MSLTKTFISIGIALVLAVFVGYAVHVLYEPPSYWDSPFNNCSYEYQCQQMMDDCQIVNQTNTSGEVDKYVYPYPLDSQCARLVEESMEYKQCQLQLEQCNNQYQKTTPQYKHYRVAFYALIILGLISIILGTVFFLGFEGISGGMIGGGVLIILWSLIYTTQYWIHAGKYLKLVILAIVLAILIYLAYKRVEQRRPPGSNVKSHRKQDHKNIF